MVFLKDLSKSAECEILISTDEMQLSFTCRILRMLELSAKPDDQNVIDAWQSLQHKMNIAFPEDIIKLTQRIGPGSFFDRFQFFVPLGRFNTPSGVAEYLAEYNDLRACSPAEKLLMFDGVSGLFPAAICTGTRGHALYSIVQQKIETKLVFTDFCEVVVIDDISVSELFFRWFCGEHFDMFMDRPPLDDVGRSKFGPLSPSLRFFHPYPESAFNAPKVKRPRRSKLK